MQVYKKEIDVWKDQYTKTLNYSLDLVPDIYAKKFYPESVY